MLIKYLFTIRSIFFIFFAAKLHLFFNFALGTSIKNTKNTDS